MTARIVALFLCRAHGRPVEPVAEAGALEDRGLDGDLHAKPGSRRQVLLVEREQLERFGLAPGEIREQVTVEGLDLKALALGTRLRAGTALLEAAGLCAPCEFIDRTRPGLRGRIGDDRGRFVRVVTAGRLAVGDRIVVESATP